MRRVTLAAFAALLIAVLPMSAGAAPDPPKERGLLVTPIRQYATIDPGKRYDGRMTVANLTKNVIDVSLSAEQFSVVDYSYDYEFKTPHEDWVRVAVPQLHLAAGANQEIRYSITIPKTAEPGGHYFTLFASATLGTGEKVRAATMLYVTVKGDLVRASTIMSENIPPVAFGGDIPFHLNVRDTGNTHFFVYALGRLDGLTVQPEHSETAHILLPQTVRSIDGAISPPILPGVYKATYGYKTEEGKTVTHSKYIFYAPLWSWALLAGLAWFAIIFFKRRKRIASKSE